MKPPNTTTPLLLMVARVDAIHHKNTQGERAAILVQNSSNSGNKGGMGQIFRLTNHPQQHPKALRMGPKLEMR